ncbi:MAG: sugar transferase [Candidatus Paceibacterota bacterium]|jgi:lipopolysaccharide/colanic/teichoic acid biosynthesis glycosyltransferase
MSIQNHKESLVLLLGDLVAFTVSLWLAIALRSGAIPTGQAFTSLLTPFSILFLLWVLSFFIAGLYEKQRIVRRTRLPELLLKTQIWNSVVAIIFFYTVDFGVEPKTILFIYIILSLLLTFLWRIYALSFFDMKYREKAMMIGSGPDADEVKHEVNSNMRIPFEIAHTVDTKDMAAIDFKKDILEKVKSGSIATIIVDSQDPKVIPVLPELYELLFSKVRFLDLYTLYEDIFDRVPISLLQYGWFIENVSLSPHAFYDMLKRLMDIVLACLILIFTMVIALPIWVALRLEGVKRLWSFQERVGQYGKTIRLMKFPTMLFDDNGKWESGKKNRVTRVGAFLRKTRLDEFPQAWNLLKGDVSFIGPRSEFPSAVSEYAKLIPYYSARFIVRPGLSGWAQLYGEHPHHGIDVDATRNKLSYDLFYIKNRSLALDIVIALKTIKTMLSREGI